MARKTGVAEPRSAVEIAEQVKLARRLISLAGEQARQALINVDLAKVGLADLEAELAVRGMASAGGGQ